MKVGSAFFVVIKKQEFPTPKWGLSPIYKPERGDRIGGTGVERANE